MAEATEYELKGYRFSSKDILYINIYGLHHDPTYYPSPFEFEPERWSEEMVKQLPRFAYLPFGAGPRQCIGKAFGMQEAMLVLATIVQQYKLELAPGQKVKPVPSLTLRPHDLNLVVQVRK